MKTLSAKMLTYIRGRSSSTTLGMRNLSKSHNNRKGSITLKNPPHGKYVYMNGVHL